MKSKEEILAMAVDIVKTAKIKKNTAHVLREVFNEIDSILKSTSEDKPSSEKK